MRLGQGKGNSARKILAFYRVNFGISSPYQVLCDGPTIYLSLKNDLYIKESLPKLLGTTAYPVLTNCIVEELKALGEEYSNAALFAKRVTRIPCAHENPVSATECLISRVKKNEDQKCIVATNDTDILVKLTRIPGVPVITVVNETKLVLKPPSRMTNEVVQKGEKQKSIVLNQSDKALVEKIKVADLDLRKQNRRLRKRKRPKEPNPLSVKKSKVRHETDRNENEDKTHQPMILTEKKSESNVENPKEMTISEKNSAPILTGKKKRKRYRSKNKSRGDEQKVISKETPESDVKAHLDPGNNNEVEGNSDQHKSPHTQERQVLNSLNLNKEEKITNEVDKHTRKIHSEKAKVTEIHNRKTADGARGAPAQVLKSKDTEIETRADPTNHVPDASQPKKSLQTNKSEGKIVQGSPNTNNPISIDEKKGSATDTIVPGMNSPSPPGNDQKSNALITTDQPKKKQRKNRRRRAKKVDTDEAVKSS